MGSEAVYTVDLVICMRTHIIATMFILSGPNAALWCGIKLKYVVVFSRTVALRTTSRGIKGKAVEVETSLYVHARACMMSCDV